jgi:anti-anti-sigma factor
VQGSDGFPATVGIAVGVVGLNGSSLPRLALTGELDIAGVPAVEAALAELEAARPPAIVLDLTRLAFVDSSGMRCVVRAHGRVVGAGGRFAVLAAGGSRVAATFELVGLDEHLPIFADLDAALAG